MSGRRLELLAFALASALLASTLARPAHAGALEQAPPSFKTWVEGLPEDQRRPLLRRLDGMPAQRRQLMFRRWESMEPAERREFQTSLEQRAQARQRGERPPRRFDRLSPESKQRLGPLVQRWRGMQPAERGRMRQRLERFRTLEPEAQKALIDKKFEAKSPEERERILESLREASKALPPVPAD